MSAGMTVTEKDRVKQAVNELVLAELFLVQATIESATAIGDGLSALTDDTRVRKESVASVLARTADEALEPYTSRLKLYRELLARQPGNVTTPRLPG